MRARDRHERDRHEEGADATSEALTAAEELHPWLDALFGDAPDGVAISRCGRLLYANPRLEDQLGALEDGELVGRASLELYAEAERPTVLAHVQSMVFSQHPQEPVQATLRRCDGIEVRLEVARMLLPAQSEPLLIEVLRALPED